MIIAHFVKNMVHLQLIHVEANQFSLFYFYSENTFFNTVIQSQLDARRHRLSNGPLICIDYHAKYNIMTFNILFEINDRILNLNGSNQRLIKI